MRRSVCAVLFEPGNYTGAIGSRAVLAHLPFSVQFGNFHLNADDAPDLSCQEWRGSVAHAPWLGACGFVESCEVGDLPCNPFGVVDHRSEERRVGREV